MVTPPASSTRVWASSNRRRIPRTGRRAHSPVTHPVAHTADGEDESGVSGVIGEFVP